MDEIFWSKNIPGSPRNYNWGAQFCLTDGFLRISQNEGGSKTVKDVVLLSPKQVKAMLDFLRANNASSGLPVGSGKKPAKVTKSKTIKPAVSR